MMSLSGYEYDFFQLLLLSIALLTGSYLLDKWFPYTSGPAMPLLLVTSMAAGIFKAGFSVLQALAKRTGLYRRGKSVRIAGVRISGGPRRLRRSESAPKQTSEDAGPRRIGGEKLATSDWMVILYRGIPLNTLSRLWGKLHQMELPTWFRPHAFRLYIWLYGCRLDEALNEDLYHYKNLSEFFRRPLKPHVRPIHPFSSLISPVDGQVLYCGRVEAGHMEQVKGVRYTLQGFLGPASWRHKSFTGSGGDVGGPFHRCSSSHTFQDGLSEDHAFQESVKLRTNTDLYHCVLYLAPGDYHRFHAASDWKVKMRRHFPGKLLSVNPRVASWVRGLFSLNERAVYFGEWQHGFFSYTAVGATNVGSIRVFSDPKLQTNTRHRQRPQRSADSPTPLKSFYKPGQSLSTAQSAAKKRLFYDRVLQTPQEEATNQEFKRGDLFGEFNFGSTVVLIFEAPKDFRFNVSPQQKVKFGQSLGSLFTDVPRSMSSGPFTTVGLSPEEIPIAI